MSETPYVPLNSAEVLGDEPSSKGSTTLSLIALLLFVSIAVVHADLKFMTLQRHISVSYSGVNTPKTLVFSSCFIAFALMTYRNRLFFAPTLAFISFSIYFMPMQCALGLCYYNTTLAPAVEGSAVKFLAIGDPQIIAWEGRHRYNQCYVRALNEFSESNDGLLGCLIAGDTVQSAEDGRYGVTFNYIGEFEKLYGVAGEGELKVPAYECLGNHDAVVRWPRNTFIYGNPSRDMINRRNRHRHYLVQQDTYGNYHWKWGALNLISVNVWPLRRELVGTFPYGSLDFLKKVLPQLPQGERWVLLTHFLPTKLRSPVWEDVNEFGDAIRPYRNTSVAIFIGHIHLETTLLASVEGFKVIALPAPARAKRLWDASLSNAEFVSCSFDIGSGELTVDRVQYGCEEEPSLQVLERLDLEKFNSSFENFEEFLGVNI